MKAYLSIQCDAPDGTTGTFLSDANKVLVSPVMPDCVALFNWANRNGWKSLPYNAKHPVGVYSKGEG